ncbi:MAG TPA: hypothetical protein VNN15_03240 [Solirubrobacterales bacterium]|nr:hypothetical protein [Solirubrobacterales bacterium]
MLTPAEILLRAAEQLRRHPEGWYRAGTSLATVVVNVPGSWLDERRAALALLRRHLGGTDGAYFLAEWSRERGHEEAIEALEQAARAAG